MKRQPIHTESVSCTYRLFDAFWLNSRVLKQWIDNVRIVQLTVLLIIESHTQCCIIHTGRKEPTFADQHMG